MRINSQANNEPNAVEGQYYQRQIIAINLFLVCFVTDVTSNIEEKLFDEMPPCHRCDIQGSWHQEGNDFWPLSLWRKRDCESL